MVDVRADAFAQAVAAIDVQHAGGAAFAIVGDAGIGKSTLVRRISEHARASNVPVVATRWSDDGALPPMWSWSVLFRSWAQVVGPLRALEEVHPLVRRLAPETVEAAGLSVPDAPGDEVGSRYLMGDALGRLLARAESRLLVVLEDLHYAPPGGLDFLPAFVAAALHGPVVIVATTREGADVVALTSLPDARRIDLPPLPADTAAEVVRSVNPALDEDAVRSVVDGAAGNPFFLCELARLAALGDERVTTTPAVRDVVLQRVNALGDEAYDVLSVAALLGHTPAPDVVAAVIGDDNRTDRVIDAAERAHLLESDGGALRFTHDLVRGALVDSLRSRAALRLHARIAEVMRADPHADRFELAHHFLESGAVSEEAATAGESAALGALDAGALEDAVSWADRTRAVAARLPDGSERLRRLDFLAGRALVGLSQYGAGKERLVRAAEAAVAAGNGPAATEALLTIGAEKFRGRSEYEPPRDLLERALALVEDDLGWKCRLIGRSADLRRGGRARQLADTAVELARAAGEPDVLIPALGRVLVEWRDSASEERRTMAEELARLGQHASPERAFEAIAYRIVVLTEMGEFDAAARLIPVVNAAVLRLGLPAAVSFDRTAALIALLQGRFDEADEIVARIARGGDPIQVAEVEAIQSLYIGLAACLRGDFGVLGATQTYLDAATGARSETQVLAVQAFLAAHARDWEPARNAVERVFAVGLDGFAAFNFGTGDVLQMLLAEAVCLLDDVEHAKELEPIVRKYEGRMAVGGMAPVAAFGSADHVLALLAKARGDLAAARRHIEVAIAFHRRMRAQPLEARSALVAAELALADGDVKASVSHARSAARLALRFDMRPTVEAAARVLAAAGAAPVRGATVGGLSLALVFTDIESSTQSAAALGDAAWVERLRDHDRTVRQLVAQHGGREVKHLGDGFMLTFPTAAAAVEFTRALQSAFRAGVVRVRAGVHVGPIVEEDGDVFGKTVNVAARVCAAASGGETLVSDDVLALVPTATGESREVVLKGVEEPMRLHPLTPA